MKSASLGALGLATVILLLLLTDTEIAARDKTVLALAYMLGAAVVLALLSRQTPRIGQPELGVLPTNEVNPAAAKPRRPAGRTAKAGPGLQDETPS